MRNREKEEQEEGQQMVISWTFYGSRSNGCKNGSLGCKQMERAMIAAGFSMQKIH